VISRFLLSIFIAAVPATQALGQPVLRFCSLDIDFAPVARVDGTGHYQFLLMQAARKAGITVERRIAPRRRCLDEIRAGISDGMIGAYTPERALMAAFPQAGDSPDVTKSFGTVRYYPYRRVASPVSWDGQRFHGLDGSVGVESAFVFVTDRLRALGVRYDDGAKTLEQNMDKLRADRVDVVIGMDLEADRLVASRHAGRIERAGGAFDLSPMYLMLSKQFYAGNPQAAQRLWQAVQEVRNSQAYRQYVESHP
jgi:polar amino acid transport system substrate-binding protein